MMTPRKPSDAAQLEAMKNLKEILAEVDMLRKERDEARRKLQHIFDADSSREALRRIQEVANQ